MTHFRFDSPSRVLVAALGLLCAASTGCTNSGLDKYDDTGDEPTVVDEAGDAEDPSFPPIDLDNCLEACAQQEFLYAPLGCDMSCDINLGTSFEGDASAAVVSLLVSGWVDADGVFQTGESCDFVVSCPELTECQSLALVCLRESSSDVTVCLEQYLECDEQQFCQDQADTCNEAVLETFLDCTDPPADCVLAFDAGTQVCTDQYNNCLGAFSGPAPVPPAPVMTSPGRFDVPMEFVHYYLKRLAVVDGETFLMVMPNAQGVARSVAVNDIEGGEALDKLGLQSGDRILAVNDKPVLQFVDDPGLLLPLLDGSGVKLRIRRKGTNRDLRYRFVD